MSEDPTNYGEPIMAARDMTDQELMDTAAWLCHGLPLQDRDVIREMILRINQKNEAIKNMLENSS